jgi:phospholipid/cholesterol/gamma-HCH transport system substrate-binding protein
MNRGRDLLVGGVIIIGIAIAVFGTLWLKGVNWGRPSVEVQALLTDVAQLQPGNAVKYRGVKIGKVSAIEVEPSGQAVRVTFLLDRKIAFPKHPVVVVAPESLFGSWEAEIASRDRYPRFSFFKVTPADVQGGVPVLGGYALPELSRLTASAEEISDNLADLSARFDIAFSDSTAHDLAQAINNMQVISQEIRQLVVQQSAIAKHVMSKADTALTEIEGASRVARSSFERVNVLLSDAQLDSIVTNVRLASHSIAEVSATLQGSTGNLPETMARADSAFARLDRLTASIEAGRGTLGRLVVDTTLATRTADVLDQLNLLLKDVRANPRRYVRLSIF